MFVHLMTVGLPFKQLKAFAEVPASGEQIVAGRLFVNHTARTLRDSLASMPIDVAEIWVSNDVRPNRANDTWLNAIAVGRSGQPAS